MNKRRILLPVVAALPLLASCSEASGVSSTSSSSPLPVLLHENYRREGTFSMQLGLSIAGIQSVEQLYESPISLDYQVDERKNYGSSASFEIRPYDLDGTQEERLDQANRNRSVLHALFSGTSTLLDALEQDPGFLPVLADRYSGSFEDSGQIPDETFAFQTFDSLTYVVDTTREDGKDVLRFLAAQEETDDGGLNIDFSNLQIDVPALLHYLQDLLPGEAVLRPIFATVGDVVQFLANGLSLRLSTPSAEETKITLFLNEEGRTTLSRSLSNALGTTILEGLSIGEMSLSVSLFDDETLFNQLESCHVDFSLTLPQASLDLDIEAELEREHERIEDDRFDAFPQDMEQKMAVCAEVQDFYDAVTDVIPWQDEILGEGSVDPQKVDLSHAAVAQMQEQAEKYFAFSEEGKALLGSRFQEASSSESLSNILLSAHQEGVDAINRLRERFAELEDGLTDDNYQSIYQDVASYMNWEQGMRDYGAQEEMEAFDTYRQDRMDRVELALQEARPAFDAFVSNPGEDNLDTAVSLCQEIDDLLSLDSRYLTGDIQDRQQALSEAYQEETQPLAEAYHQYFAALLPSLDYEGLSSLAATPAVSHSAFYSVDALSEAERETISSLLRGEAQRLKQNLLDHSSSYADLEQQYLADQQSLATLEETERSLLSTTRYASDCKDFKVELESILRS